VGEMTKNYVQRRLCRQSSRSSFWTLATGVLCDIILFFYLSLGAAGESKVLVSKDASDAFQDNIYVY
jgi:hypothetical protein